VVERDGERIVFMHNLIAGSAESSFGVEVAKIAGMPQALIARAYEILSSK
jgi:DNA mismatch repair protein MutS